MDRVVIVLVQESNGAARSLYESLGYQRVWTRNIPAARISQVFLPPALPPFLHPSLAMCACGGVENGAHEM